MSSISFIPIRTVGGQAFAGADQGLSVDAVSGKVQLGVAQGVGGSNITVRREINFDANAELALKFIDTTIQIAASFVYQTTTRNAALIKRLNNFSDGTSAFASFEAQNNGQNSKIELGVTSTGNTTRGVVDQCFLNALTINGFILSAFGGDISLGKGVSGGTSIVKPDELVINVDTGEVSMASLAGVGSRAVMVDANGVLSAP